jgi:hypothetical protein
VPLSGWEFICCDERLREARFGPGLGQYRPVMDAVQIVGNCRRWRPRLLRLHQCGERYTTSASQRRDYATISHKTTMAFSLFNRPIRWLSALFLNIQQWIVRCWNRAHMQMF